MIGSNNILNDRIIKLSPEPKQYKYANPATTLVVSAVNTSIPQKLSQVM